VPFAPAGFADRIARVIASEMSETHPQRVYVENKPGAGGILALAEVARAYASAKPIVFLAWDPHPMNMQFDLRYLSGGDTTFGPNYGGARVLTLARTGYVQQCPNVGRLLRNLVFTTHGESEIMRSILAEHKTPEVAAGEWLLLDFGAQVDGYCADITRTVVVGARATEWQRVLYALVREAQQRARCGVRAGMSGRDADALARDPIAARGFGEAFGHSLGHGLGLEVHEAPRLSKINPDPLPAGAVVTIEPGVYVAGDGGVRIEDDVHLAATGPELLSDGLTDLLELV